MDTVDDLLVIGRMKGHQMRSKLQPLIALDCVGQILLVRRFPLYNGSECKVRECCPPSWMQGSVVLSELYRIGVLIKLLLSTRKPIVLGVQFMPHGIYAHFFGLLSRCPVVQLLVGEDIEKVISRKGLWRMLSRAARVGVRGEQSRARLISGGIPEKKVFVAPNIFDVGLFEPDDKVEKCYDLISVGELIERKQHAVLIKAVSLLREKRPEVTLALVGDGPVLKELTALVAEHGLGNNVHFLGLLQYDEISAVLKQSRTFVLASRAEGLPMAMIEAMSCGLPVIVPDVNDVLTVAEHGTNALVVNSGADAKCYADAMGSLLGDDELYGQLQAGALESRKIFMNRNSLQVVAEIWSRALKDIR